MSLQNVRQYERHCAEKAAADRANATTLPPPPKNDPAAAHLKEARRCHALASRYLAKALEAEAMAEFLGAKPYNEVSR